MAKKILVVDDKPYLVDLMASRLKANGYEVVTATNGREGLEKAKEETPDLILLDIAMPDMDGYRVLRHLKEFPGTQDIPVMILTVKKWNQDIQKAIAAGAADYIVKPFDPVKLLEKIGAALQNA